MMDDPRSVLCGWDQIQSYVKIRSVRWLQSIAKLGPDYPNPLPLYQPGLRSGKAKTSVTMRVGDLAVWMAREGLGPMPRFVEVILSCQKCEEATDHRFKPRYECLGCGTERGL